MDKKTRLGAFGILFPVPENEETCKGVKFTSLQDLLDHYDPAIDPKGAMPRRLECHLRYLITGKLERVHPDGTPDIIVKSGVTLEVKTGHGWAIEPVFQTMADLETFLDERKNPLLMASHIAYYPFRPTCDDEVYDCIILPAIKFWKILASYGKLVVSQDRHTKNDEEGDRIDEASWGVKMKPWIAEGYAQKSSKANDQAIRDELTNAGETIWEFAERMGFTLHE